MGLAGGSAVALAVIAVAVSAYAGTRSELRGQLDSSLRSLAAPIAQRAQSPPGPTRSGGPPLSPPSAGDGDCDLGLGLDVGRGGPGFGGATGLREFVSRSGRTCVLGGGSTTLPVTQGVKNIAARGTGQLFTDEEVSGHHLRVLVAGLPGRGALQVALPLTDIDKSLRDELLLLIVIAASGIALAALLGVFVARTALSPIARFTRRTESIAADTERIEQRLEVVGGDELARLARTFNATLDALERSVEAQRNLVADASHELRTPIATIRANLQLMRDESLLSAEDREALRGDVIQELDELTALVSDIVELARGTKASAEPGDVRLDLVAADAVDKARRRSPQIRFQTTLAPTVVRGEGERMARAVANLLDNACKWSPPGGVVEVSLRDGTVTVRDHGPGFHAEDLPFVFDRFHRARDARSKPGSGLGLAIVRQAAEAHGGSVEAANAPDGGAILRISFGPPLALDDAGDADTTRGLDRTPTS
jgi:two-component system sensor histidine kinase MprB